MGTSTGLACGAASGMQAYTLPLHCVHGDVGADSGSFFTAAAEEGRFYGCLGLLLVGLNTLCLPARCDRRVRRRVNANAIS